MVLGLLVDPHTHYHYQLISSWMLYLIKWPMPTFHQMQVQTNSMLSSVGNEVLEDEHYKYQDTFLKSIKIVSLKYNSNYNAYKTRKCYY